MTALLAYQSALLLRSQRWLPPVILYAAFLAIGVRSGQPVLDSQGFAAIAVLPVTAWFVRICATNEPPAARSCTAAAAGPARAHLAGLLTAALAAVLVGVAGALVVALISDPTSTDGRTAIAMGPALAAGLLATLVCAALGAGIGAVTTRPVLRGTARSVPVMLVATVVALVTAGSPARAAVSTLTAGSQSGVVSLPALPLLAAVLLAGAAATAACAMSARRP